MRVCVIVYANIHTLSRGFLQRSTDAYSGMRSHRGSPTFASPKSMMALARHGCCGGLLKRKEEKLLVDSTHTEEEENKLKIQKPTMHT